MGGKNRLFSDEKRPAVVCFCRKASGLSLDSRSSRPAHYPTEDGDVIRTGQKSIANRASKMSMFPPEMRCPAATLYTSVECT